MALNAWWTIVALLVGASAVGAMVAIARSRHGIRLWWVNLVCAGIATSAVGWLGSTGLMLAAPPSADHGSTAETVVAAAGVVLSVGLLLAAVEMLPSQPESAAARLRRAVDGLQVTCALALAGWIIAGLWFAPGGHITVHHDLSWIATSVALVAAATAAGVTVVTILQTPPPRQAAGLLMFGVVAVAFGGTGTVIAAADFRSPATVATSGLLATIGMASIGYAASVGRRLIAPAPQGAPTRWGLPFATVGVALSMILVQLVVGGPPDEVGAIISVLTGFVLVLRQALALADGRRYLARLHADQQRLRELAYTDPLTGVGNRRSLMSTLDTVIAERRDGLLVMLDLDRFTNVNDVRGHDAGDAVLAEVGARLRSVLRPADVAARTGGDEFAVVLCPDADDVDRDDADGHVADGNVADGHVADGVVDRLVSALAAPYETHTGTVAVAASIGLVPCRVASDVPTLLRNADVALRFAKRSGAGAVQRYDAAYDDYAQRRIRIEQNLRDALRANEFTLAYQPIVALPHGRAVAMEALIRWHNAELGRVPPDEFIPIAEEVGLITAIDRWVMQQACAQLARWLANGYELWMSVNVSVRELHQPDYVHQVVETLGSHHLPPERLVLELTEHSAAPDVESLAVRLNALREAGLRIALDDFGAGYSSLGQLRSLPVDILKIDRSLVGEPGIGGPPRAVAPLVDVVVQLGNRLSLDVIAEGVGDAAQRAVVEEAGCALGQGDLFGRPMAAEHVVALLSAEPSSTPLDAAPSSAPRQRHA